MLKAPAINYINATLTALILVLLTTSCQNGPEIINDVSKASFEVVDQDSNAVNFPQDFKGTYTVVGFIYTHCPDVCNIISAKLSNVSDKLKDDSDIRFVEISFDPKRDTPSVLKKYLQKFNLNKRNFTALTGDSATIGALLDSMHITAKVAYTKTDESGEKTHIMNHTNRILVMDKQARVRYEYPGSAVLEKFIIEDLNTLK